MLQKRTTLNKLYATVALTRFKPILHGLKWANTLFQYHYLLSVLTL